MNRRDWLKAASAATVGFSSFRLGWAAGAESKRTGAEPKPKRLLYYTASVGFAHPPVQRQNGQPSLSEKVFAQFGERAGFAVECTQDGRVFDGDLNRYDAIAFYTCGDLTQPNLAGSPPMTPQGKQRLLDAIAAGKGFVGFHSAADTFHSQGPRDAIQTELDPYVAMLGGEFVSHGPSQEAGLMLVPGFPGAGDLGCAEGLSFTDEWYALKNFAKDLHVILVQETKYLQGECYRRPNYPSTWARRHGQGRVFYTSLGHHEEIWTNPFFQAIVLGGIAWALGNVEANVKPNLDTVAPHANQLKS